MTVWLTALAGVTLGLALAVGQQAPAVMLARDLIKSGRLPEAEQILRAAIEAGQDTAEAHGELGYLLYQGGRFHEAVPELGRAVQLDPALANYSMKLAGAILGERRYSVALEFLTRVRARFKDLPEFQYNLGLCHYGIGDYARAAGAFRRALELAPDMHLAHFFMGNTYAAGRQLEKAIQEYRVALKLNPENAGYCFALGKVLGRMGPEFDPEAIRWLTKALQLKPGDVPSEFELGRVCERTGNLACARPLLEDVVARYPDELSSHVVLSRIYVKLNLPERAARERQQARHILASRPRKSLPEASAELPGTPPTPPPPDQR